MIKSALHPIRQLLRYLGFDVVRYRSDRDRQADLYQEISKLTGNVVSSGPFAGMHLTELNSWGGGDRAAKLLGYYEMELNPFLEESIAWQPDVVVNVGCAEGYFAVGLAMRVADARVIAFDVDGQAQAVCKAAANLNDLSVDVRGLCTGSILRVICETARRPFLLIDCEGGERELLIEGHIELDVPTDLTYIGCRSGGTHVRALSRVYA